MAKQTDVELVDVLFRAIIREREALSGGVRPSKDTWFKNIDGPPGRGIYYTGDDGWDAWWSLTDSAMRSAGIILKGDRSKTRIILGKVLMRKFAVEEFPVDKKNVARALNEATNIAKSEFVDRTHFIPCQITTFSTGNGIELGPVKFLTRKEAKAALRAAFKNDDTIRSKSITGDRDHIGRAIGHYKGYQWFAQVRVRDCARARSEEIALGAASSALDFLHALVGWRASREMSIAGKIGHFDRTAAIMRDEPAGTLSITTGWQMRGESFPDGWTEELKTEMDIGLHRVGLILECCVDPDLIRPIARRMCDVAQWFGEAVRDPSPSTRIIKFVTALERLTLTEKVNDVAESVSERVVALTVGRVDNLSFYPSKKLFKKIYGVRSDLVHGTLSPNDPKVTSVVRQAGDYAETAILGALFYWSPENFSSSEFTPSKLGKWYDECVAICKSDSTIGIVSSSPN